MRLWIRSLATQFNVNKLGMFSLSSEMMEKRVHIYNSHPKLFNRNNMQSTGVSEHNSDAYLEEFWVKCQSKKSESVLIR